MIGWVKEGLQFLHFISVQVLTSRHNCWLPWNTDKGSSAVHLIINMPVLSLRPHLVAL